MGNLYTSFVKVDTLAKYDKYLISGLKIHML